MLLFHKHQTLLKSIKTNSATNFCKILFNADANNKLLDANSLICKKTKL